MAQSNPGDRPEGAAPEPVCHLCGARSDQRVLLPCIKRGAHTWVCVRCLPPLIHGH